MVIWIIGLSGSGKTTLANAVYEKLQKNDIQAVILDGDDIRETFGNDLGYSIDDRRRNAERICRLGRYLENYKINVIVPILSIFSEHREWNKKNLQEYREVFIDSTIESLISRDTKGIYKRFLMGEINNVAGMDLEFEEPNNPDIHIKNNKNQEDLLAYVEDIFNFFIKL